MYAVIFKATMKNTTQEYIKTAQSLRELAFKEYHCLDFVSVCENKKEITISYWENKEDIRRWKQNPKHQQAQKKGYQNWYEEYSVEVVEVLKQYSK
jgi:heme-degrading monooxygenase HmoA